MDSGRSHRVGYRAQCLSYFIFGARITDQVEIRGIFQHQRDGGLPHPAFIDQVLSKLRDQFLRITFSNYRQLIPEDSDFMEVVRVYRKECLVWEWVAGSSGAQVIQHGLRRADGTSRLEGFQAYITGIVGY